MELLHKIEHSDYPLRTRYLLIRNRTTTVLPQTRLLISYVLERLNVSIGCFLF